MRCVSCVVCCAVVLALGWCLSLSFIGNRLRFVACCVLVVVRCRLFVVCCVLCGIASCVVLVDACMLLDVWCSFAVVVFFAVLACVVACCVLIVVWCLLFAII